MHMHSFVFAVTVASFGMINLTIAAPNNGVSPVGGLTLFNSCNTFYLDSDGWTLEANCQIKNGGSRLHTMLNLKNCLGWVEDHGEIVCRPGL
jgi:hypothetical protein